MESYIISSSQAADTPETFHPASSGDKTAAAGLRAMVESNKGKLRGAAARVPYNEIMNRVVPPEGVSYQEDTLGGISGWWCRPEGARSGEALLHLHGGWFTFGSAQAFRHLVGHIAKAAGAAAFIPEYRLAPEHPFPAAIDDAVTVYKGLLQAGFRRIAVTGDSAGGGLALLLPARLRDQQSGDAGETPVGAVALSPTTDLALTGESWRTRAAADPYFTMPQVSAMVTDYLAGVDPRNPNASPLYGDLHGLPAVRIHVGNDEVLLDDSKRYNKRAVEAGVDAKLDIWECMMHGFLGGVGRMAASQEALNAIGAFLRERLAGSQA